MPRSHPSGQPSGLGVPVWTDLEWASKRWRRASVLHLQLHDGVVRRLPAVLANQPLAAGWLTELQVGRRVTGRGDSCDNASLLSHAPSLTMLAWRTHRLDDCTRMLMRMPCLTQLRHLVLLLEATCFGNDRMCISEAAKRNAKELTEGLRDSLVQLPALETLHLKQISCHHPESTGLNLRLPPLCLIACARLRYVCLDAFVAGSIGVPEGCSMSACFLAGSAALLQDAHWRRMLSQLRRIALSSSVWGGYHEDTKRLMEILQCCPLMRDLRLDLLSDADDQQHVFALDGSLAGLETLSVSAHKLMVFVPACARWRCIRLWCSGQLNVIFEDVGAFALHTKAFVFAGLHQHMENSASMASLCDALAARSVPKSISSFPGDPHIAALHSQHYTPENLQYEPACIVRRLHALLAAQWADRWTIAW